MQENIGHVTAVRRTKACLLGGVNAKQKNKRRMVADKMWMTLVILIYLVILGIKDYVDRKIPLLWLVVGAFVLTGMGIYSCVQGKILWTDMLLGLMPGVLLLVIAWLSGKAGYADGVVLIELGVCLGYRESVLLFGFSLLLLSVVSVTLLFLRKVRKDTKMPYLPFLAVIFLLRQL